MQNKSDKDKAQATYKKKLEGMTETELRKACNDMIWLSAYATSNPRSDFHWQCDAAYDECKSRDKVSIYSEEHAALVRQVRSRGQ